MTLPVERAKQAADYEAFVLAAKLSVRSFSRSWGNLHASRRTRPERSEQFTRVEGTNDPRRRAA
jgi:hypothetical protein